MYFIYQFNLIKVNCQYQLCQVACFYGKVAICIQEITYSTLSDSTGFFLAACQLFQLVTSRAASNVINPAIMKIHQLILVL